MILRVLKAIIVIDSVVLTNILWFHYGEIDWRWIAQAMSLFFAVACIVLFILDQIIYVDLKCGQCGEEIRMTTLFRFFWLPKCSCQRSEK